MKKLAFIFVFISNIIVSQVDNNSIQSLFIKQLNSYRAKNGMNELTINLDAQAAAKIQSDYLASTLKVVAGKLTGKCGHIHPTLNSPKDRLLNVNPQLINVTVAENAASSFVGVTPSTTEQLVNLFLDMWKKSPGHNAALIDDYNFAGISVSVNIVNTGNITFYYYTAVLVFGRIN
jgi:uncharacterized protein YkwD